MNCTIRLLTLTDESFLWDMLYQALYVPEGHDPFPRDVLYRPELARYVQGWGRDGDGGFLASDGVTGQAIGAVWVRLLVGDNQGYGYVDDDTPELSIAVLPEYRRQGVGSRLLTHLLASAWGQGSISLSVSAGNPAVRLYKRFGFVVVSGSQETFTMKLSG